MPNQLSTEELCPTCQVVVAVAHRAAEARSVLRVSFCPRCGWNRSEPGVEGSVEVERAWWVELRPNALTTEQILSLRRVQPGKDAESTTAFAKRVRSAEVLRIGPFWPKPEASKAAQTLADAGLAVTITT